MTTPMWLTVNGRRQIVQTSPDLMLLEVLRDQLGLTGAKAGCRRGECGACTVLIGGRSVLACMSLIELVDEPVLTIEGIASEIEPLRAAFADCGAFQCGFCTSGQLVQAYFMLRAGLSGDDEQAEAELRRGISGNLCRCTGYTGIVEAILSVRQAAPGAEGA